MNLDLYSKKFNDAINKGNKKGKPWYYRTKRGWQMYSYNTVKLSDRQFIKCKRFLEELRLLDEQKKNNKT